METHARLFVKFHNEMKVFISQSNYIPWKGYFDAINEADIFVLYDDMQYTKGDWRNRNQIKTPNGLKWLSIPVQVKGKYYQKINETKVVDNNWRKKHWQSVVQNYSKTPFFKEYGSLFEDLYLSSREQLLSRINYSFLIAIAKLLGITSQIKWSSEFELKGDKNQKLINICKELKVTQYLSGPTAADYLDENLFSQSGIEVKWMDYTSYAEYPQLFGSFEHGVTILDLIFNTGPKATTFMKSF